MQGGPSKHYDAEAGQALPAPLIGLVGAVGQVGVGRLALPRLMIATVTGESPDAVLETRLMTAANLTLVAEEALIVDAGFELADLLGAGGRFVVRLPNNFTARLTHLPAYPGQGRPPEYGEVVRPLAPRRSEVLRLLCRVFPGCAHWPLGDPAKRPTPPHRKPQRVGRTAATP